VRNHGTPAQRILRVITCRELADFLNEYLDGALPPRRRAEFERHLEACPECVRYLQNYRETIRLGKQAFASDAKTVPDRQSRRRPQPRRTGRRTSDSSIASSNRPWTTGPKNEHAPVFAFRMSEVNTSTEAGALRLNLERSRPA
jgi:anti-sigma factor RsiW